MSFTLQVSSLEVPNDLPPFSLALLSSLPLCSFPSPSLWSLFSAHLFLSSLHCCSFLCLFIRLSLQFCIFTYFSVFLSPGSLPLLLLSLFSCLFTLLSFHFSPCSLLCMFTSLAVRLSSFPSFFLILPLIATACSLISVHSPYCPLLAVTSLRLPPSAHLSLFIYLYSLLTVHFSFCCFDYLFASFFVHFHAFLPPL